MRDPWLIGEECGAWFERPEGPPPKTCTATCAFGRKDRLNKLRRLRRVPDNSTPRAE